jgi:hypothetical protein
MADSKDNKATSDDFADDLDAMLNEANTSSNDVDEFIDDEDAIDKLLMDDSIESADSDSDTEEDEFAEIDEFSEEPEPSDESTTTEEDEFDVDELISSTSTETNNDEDEFAEIDEFSEDSDIAETEQENDISEQAIEEQDDIPIEPADEFSETPDDEDDDFLMADFDISSDEVDDDFSDNSDTEINQEKLTKNPIEETPTPSTPTTPTPSVNTEEIKQINTALDEINAQIGQLWSGNEDLKRQSTENAVNTLQNNALSSEIEKLQTEQHKLKKSLKENADHVPIITYISLSIAILALLVGSGLGLIGYGAQSEVTELEELVSILEEEIEILTEKNNSGELQQIQQKLELLSKKDNRFKSQFIEINKALKTTPLKPIVDDLIEQNDHAQQAIETLLAKVETLERRKLTATRTKRVKKIVPKVKWVVNLVSFKQEWYAKRKAIEFNKKGITAEVKKVKVNGENWFRLTVKGFKSKYEAAAYAVKVKKTLNLSSAWVTKEN